MHGKYGGAEIIVVMQISCTALKMSTHQMSTHSKNVYTVLPSERGGGEI